MVLTIHTCAFLAYVGGCVGAPFIAASHPSMDPWYFIGTTVALTVLILVSWVVYKGECPFTVWENNFRAEEGRARYTEPCLDRYALLWFGFRFPGKVGVVSTVSMLVILLIPLAVGIMRLL
jgi:Protein of Unknown function (DUF2784)